MELTAGTLTLVATPFPLECECATLSDTIVSSRSVGQGLRAEVYVMVECSYFVVDGIPIEMYGESWIAGLWIQTYTA